MQRWLFGRRRDHGLERSVFVNTWHSGDVKAVWRSR